ncbi:hypothetical protein SG26_19865 (plasmid) [Haloarcula sp. CBA1115]|uniref:hypothetical protein n=1 Tax=unclassified Haloarcula TaxID=2624677 RepID=UPI00059557C7|nr:MULTISPECIES: hypothetical protein [unclassified Haloarcula]AJF28015.1 hypothetical protein SG26_19865 [Haloarcula sp. CBA1115]
MESVRDIRDKLGHGTDEDLAQKHDLDEMSSYEFRQKSEEVQQEIIEQAFENDDIDALSEGIGEIGDKDFSDHLKAGGKKGAFKSIAKGGIAGAGLMLGTASGGLPAIAAAAAIGGAGGFGSGVAKSIGLDKLDRDYQSLDGITNEVPKDASNVADSVRDWVGFSYGGDDTQKATGDAKTSARKDEFSLNNNEEK